MHGSLPMGTCSSSQGRVVVLEKCWDGLTSAFLPLVPGTLSTLHAWIAASQARKKRNDGRNNHYG